MVKEKRRRVVDGAAHPSGARTARAGSLPPAKGGKEEFTKGSFVEFQKTLREQKMLLSKMRRENVELRGMIADESQRNVATTTTGLSHMTEVSRLAEEAELYVSKIEAERRRSTDLDKSMKEIEKKLKGKRGQADGIDRFAKDARHVVAMLENKLHASKRKWGETVTENKKTRSQINEYRLEQAYFKQAYSKAEASLKNINTDIENIVSESTAVFDQRTEVLDRIANLKQVADEEQKQYMMQCRELNSVLQAFEESEGHLSKVRTALGGDELGNMSSQQDIELNRKIVKGKWQLAKEKALSDLLQDQAQGFEEAFAKIQAATGYTRMEDFVSHFVQIEEHNFHRFKYLNSLIVDIEKISEEVAQLKKEAHTFSSESSLNDRGWEKVKRTTDERIQKLEEMSSEHEVKGDEMSDTLTQAYACVERMARMTHSKLDTNLLSSDEVSVSENTFLAWLAVVESKANELVMKFSLQNRQQKTTKLPRITGDSAVVQQHQTGSGAVQSFEEDEIAAGRRAAAAAEDQNPSPSTDAQQHSPSRHAAHHPRPIVRPPSIKDDDPQFFDEDADMELPMEQEQMRARVDTISEQLVQSNVSWANEPHRARSIGSGIKQTPNKPGAGLLAGSDGRGRSLTALDRNSSGNAPGRGSQRRTDSKPSKAGDRADGRRRYTRAG